MRVPPGVAANEARVETSWVVASAVTVAAVPTTKRRRVTPRPSCCSSSIRLRS